MKYSIALPNGWKMSLVDIKDPVEAYETMTNVAKAADETGFEAIWLVDHFHTVPYPSQEVTFECWMSLAALARDTKRVRVGQIVSCNSYRNPALVAKMASTLDVLSHGRLNFGIGAGWYEHEYRAYGYPFPDGPERLIYKPELRETSLVGSPATIRQRIAALQALDVQEIIMDLPSATDLTVLYRFAHEFIA